MNTLFVLFTLLAGDLQVSITDHGAKADEKTNCTPAFNRAYAALKAKMVNGRDLEGTIYVPSAQLSYLVNDPVIIQDNNIKIKGDGKGSRILNTGFGPTFIYGIRTTEKTVTRQAALDPRYTPTKTGKLNLGGNGRRLCGDSSIAFHASPFDLGPMNPDGGFSRWAGVKILTIDLAIERHETAWRQHGILALGGMHSPVVFSLGTGGNPNQYDFLFTDEDGVRGSASFFGVAGLNKISLQVNLEDKSIQAWVNGVKKPCALNFKGTKGFKKNDFDLFLIGCDNNTSDGRIPLGSINIKMPDFSIYALTISDRLKYANLDTQSKLDGSPVDDNSQFGFDGQCVAQLYGNDTVSSSRLVSAFTGKNRYRIFYGYAMQVDQLSLLGGQSGNTLEDLQLSTLVPISPIVHSLGVLDLTVNRVSFAGGSQNLSAIPSMASYYTRINSSDFSSTDYAIVGSWSIIRARDIRFRHVGRGALLLQASDVRLSDSFVAFTSPYTETFASMYAGLYGGKYSYEDLDIDMEGPAMLVAPFYIEQSPNISTLLDLNRNYLGTSALAKPIVVSKKAIDGDRWPYKINLKDVDSIAGTPSMDIQEISKGLP